MLTGQVAIRSRDILRQIAIEHEFEIITGKVAVDHVHMFVAYRPTQNINKIMQWLKGIRDLEKNNLPQYWINNDIPFTQ